MNTRKKKSKIVSYTQEAFKLISLKIVSEFLNTYVLPKNQFPSNEITGI